MIGGEENDKMYNRKLRYAVKAWTNFAERTINIKHFYDDELNEAIQYARMKNMQYPLGQAEHSVVDVGSDAIKYRRGWMDRTYR